MELYGGEGLAFAECLRGASDKEKKVRLLRRAWVGSE